jgi:hypothetical protein
MSDFIYVQAGTEELRDRIVVLEDHIKRLRAALDWTLRVVHVSHEGSIENCAYHICEEARAAQKEQPVV